MHKNLLHVLKMLDISAFSRFKPSRKGNCLVSFSSNHFHSAKRIDEGVDLWNNIKMMKIMQFNKVSMPIMPMEVTFGTL